jgi:holo-[acyl-carrier protein] synthase
MTEESKEQQSVVRSASETQAETAPVATPRAEVTSTPTSTTEPITPVAGLGVDIIEIERMERAIKRTPRMITRMFSEQERAYAKSKRRPAVQYALFFAAKEAVLKALGTGFAGVDAFTDMEVSRDRFGKPMPVLHGRAKEIAKQQGIVDMQLSLSYTRSVGVASAVAIKEQNRPRTDEKLDQKAELAKRFKELRGMLDEMEADAGIGAALGSGTGAVIDAASAAGAANAHGASVQEAPPQTSIELKEGRSDG